MSRSHPDPRWHGRTDPEDVRVWQWTVEDEHGMQVAIEQPARVAVDGDRLVVVTSSPLVECALSFLCVGPPNAERYLVLLADGVPFLRWHAEHKRGCSRLDVALPRVLCGLT